MSNLKSLGKVIDYKYDYTPNFLETIPNKNSARNYFVKISSDEFTCLCPVTHQPDYATINIRYIPDEILVESKSLKLYLTSFRDYGIFHEEVINIVADDLIELLKPRYIEVEGIFKSRGGITIAPFVNFGREEFEGIARKILIERRC